MAGKRNATSELNHDNWNNEEEPEDAGTFTTASPEELQKRVVKTAKRRIAPGSEAPPTKNVFGSFSGFKVSSAAPTSAFSFLSKSSTTTASLPTSTATKTTSIFSKITPTTNGTKATDNGLSSSSSTKLNDSTKPATTTTTSSITNSSIVNTKSTKKVDEAANKNKEIFAMSSEYYAKLKDLNQSVSQWIKTHVDSNAFCILSPIFRDYENHLKIIQTQYGKSCPEKGQEEEKKKSPTSGVFTSGQSTASTSASVSSSASTEASDKPPATTSIFGSTQSKSIFSGISSATSSVKKPAESQEADSDINKNKNSSSIEKIEKKSLTFPQTTSLFSFGGSNSGTTASFTFGSAKPNSFNIGKSVPEETKEENKDDEDEPPKVEIKPITEEGAIYEKRCKVYFKNKETGVLSDRGIGVLFLKPTPNDKTQLIVRAETSLGNLLLNTLLTPAVPTKKINKNSVMLMCLPLADSKPPPVPVYLRVKTSEDADALLEALESNKK